MTCFDTKVKIQNKRRKILLTLQFLFPFWDYGRKWFALQDSIREHFILHDFIKEQFKNKVLFGKEIMNVEFVPKGNNVLHSPSVISCFIESFLSTWNQHCWQKLCTHRFYLGPSNFDAVSLSFSICREAANAETEWDSVKGIQQLG